MCKRWTHCAVPICCTQELKNSNFLVKFKVILVAITEFLTFGYRIRFFRSFSDYSKESLALLACQPKSLISTAFFLSRAFDSMRKKSFPCDFFLCQNLLSLCVHITLCHPRASEELLFKYHYTPTFSFSELKRQFLQKK